MMDNKKVITWTMSTKDDDEQVKMRGELTRYHPPVLPKIGEIQHDDAGSA